MSPAPNSLERSAACLAGTEQSHGTGCELSLTADETLLLWLQIELLHVPRLAAQPGGSMLEIDLPFYKNASVYPCPTTSTYVGAASTVLI